MSSDPWITSFAITACLCLAGAISSACTFGCSVRQKEKLALALGLVGIVLGALGAAVAWLSFGDSGAWSHIIAFWWSTWMVVLALILGGAATAVALLGWMVGKRPKSWSPRIRSRMP